MREFEWDNGKVPPEGQRTMSKNTTIGRITFRPTPDRTHRRQRRAATMSATQIEAAARRDLDNPPLTDADFAKMQRVPRTKTMRRAMGLTQEEFAERFHIPLGTLRDWEQGRAAPDQPARCYLKVIALDAGAVVRALAAAPPESRPRGRQG